MSATADDARPILVEEPREGIALLTLNRPRARNAVSFELWEALGEAIERIAAPTPPRAVVLTGSEGFFCAGGDIKAPPARGSGAASAAARLELGQDVMGRLRALPAPVIAAVEGGAYGIGWSLALACDVIVASEESRFRAPFLSLGLVPDGGCAWFLQRALGRYRAAEILFSERIVLAREAAALGLVSQLVPAGTALQSALDFATACGGDNRHAVELAKRLLAAADSADLPAYGRLELAYGVLCQKGEEVARVRAAQAERRRE
jgi:2-(1,2-epoxy-1,2-dihydrophenyl)acetyl-CoA isomerase